MAKKVQKFAERKVQDASYCDQIFERTSFEEVRFWNVRFVNCIWKDCRFPRVSFVRGTRFSNCRFEKCRFWRQHTYLGGPTLFERCDFQECVFENIQLWDTKFVHCKFSGRFENLVFYGPEAPKDWKTRLRDVDFSGVVMEYVSFRCGIDLSTTRLPTAGWTLD